MNRRGFIKTLIYAVGVASSPKLVASFMPDEKGELEQILYTNSDEWLPIGITLDDGTEIVTGRIPVEKVGPREWRNTSGDISARFENRSKTDRVVIEDVWIGLPENTRFNEAGLPEMRQSFRSPNHSTGIAQMTSAFRLQPALPDNDYGDTFTLHVPGTWRVEILDESTLRISV